MDFDLILKQIQSWTNIVPLIILGSGASVPFGLPSMWTLGDHIKNNCHFTDPDDKNQFSDFVDLFDKTNDLESTLLNLPLRAKVLDEIVRKTWELVNHADIKAYEGLITGITEFPLVKLIDHLLETANRKLSIVTTNYDRLGEYAASFAKAVICTGYAQNYIGHFSSSIHLNNLATLQGYKGQVNIWKVHGSLDWFKTEQENIVQLPLRHNIPDHFTPLIVTPGLSKYAETHYEPYRTIFTQADNEIEAARAYLCIGYGFNDAHVQPKLINEIRNGKPIIVLTKNLTPKTIQSIVYIGCKNYILIEELGTNDTKIYSSAYGEHIVRSESLWKLNEYMKLII